MENNNKQLKIVCLGGGIGTVNLIKGLKKYTKDITTITSMADDGGSAGRLRRLYNMFPPGDIVSCMAALANNSKDGYLSKLLTYRFEGNRYGKDDSLGGHKMGNLIMAALTSITGDFKESVAIFQKTFHIPGTFLPATAEHVNISAKTVEGKEIFGEEKIDLGKYRGKRILERVYLHPSNAKADSHAVQQIMDADIIVLGPGDLYTAVLPVLIVPDISEAIKKTKAKKVFVVNIANKPFETRGYKTQDYIDAIERHIGQVDLNLIIVNNNFSVHIPRKFHYHYVRNNIEKLENTKILVRDVVDKEFPLYHSPAKLAKVLIENI